jgi:hypothetical protein
VIIKHHFTTELNEKVSVYLFEDKYRYQVVTDKGIEYRELYDILGIIGDSVETLEQAIKEQRLAIPYGPPQMSAKCIRCSKWHGSPRKEYNLASICERCYKVMEQTDDTNNTTGNTWYGINDDGSKGPVIKEEK